MIMAAIRKRSEELWSDEPEELENMIEDELEAYQELQTLEIRNVPNDVLKVLMEAAEHEHPADYSEQRDFVRHGADRHLYVQRLKENLTQSKSC